MDILDKIIAYKRKEIVSRKASAPFAILEKKPFFQRKSISLGKQLQQGVGSGIIAEFKRKSPSRCNINLDADITEVTRGYSKAGASAISILTDSHFFGGNDSFLSHVRSDLPEMPLLRKEFIIDEYQVVESKAIGADIILLIAEILSTDEIFNLTQLAQSLGLEVLLEIHSEKQMDKCNAPVDLLGINNRDLTTFVVDYDRSKKLYDRLPVDIPKIAESGLQDAKTLAMLYAHGFSGFLIGERFMKETDPGSACKEMIDEYLEIRIPR